jgi:uncharacterized protein YlbG (UPF0298 family)
MELLILLLVIIGGPILIYNFLRSLKRKRLMEKYGDTELVSKLMSKMFWEGQTAEQLTDSLGSPRAVDRKVMKSKVREIWKYNQTSRARFGLRITLENDIVIGWDKKDG